EYELEVMRDLNDNVVIICSIENFDAMGVHTGDSITVAPAQTLTDKEYQTMRDHSINCIRKIGVETGGSNIQFAVHPDTGRMIIIEMNPRVSRSSALASKATGYPIAKIAALLSIGYTLDEILNDITGCTPASFEPTIDYVVVKIPRWDFEKFPQADKKLNTQMKSIGEVMAIGKTFKEAFQKGIRSLEQDRFGLGMDGNELDEITELAEKERDEQTAVIKEKLCFPYPERMFYIRYALKMGFSIDEIYQFSGIDRWFLSNLKEIIDIEDELIKDAGNQGAPSAGMLRKAKRCGFSDRQLGIIYGMEDMAVRDMRMEKGVKAVFKMVDTCAAEFESVTPYFYSTYEDENEVRFNDRKKIMILGGGPNRIGQGIEFD
ncbi:carbamoyl phosphate synthase large subunit, partial [bacterium]|nr:carbamoyl phosphate synthase large subunit [bacterium]